MSRCRILGVMVDIRLGIYVQTRKHTAGPPVDTIAEILSYYIPSQFKLWIVEIFQSNVIVEYLVVVK
ncbi:hypothetical protein ACTXT7_003022 [Hymenolepis weldensis]